MISKITCEATECVHNTDGQCESGMVRVDKFQNNYGAVAFCDSFAKPGSLRAMACGNLPCANAVTSYAGRRTRAFRGKYPCAFGFYLLQRPGLHL